MSESRAWDIPMIGFKEGELELSGIEVVRVLEARPRAPMEESAEAPVTAPRPVVVELMPPTRVAQSSQSKPVGASKPVHESKPAVAPKAAPASAPVPAPKPSEERDSLADTLNELRKFAFDLESDDTGSTSRVRHLHVELAESAASRKSRGPRR